MGQVIITLSFLILRLSSINILSFFKVCLGRGANQGSFKYLFIFYIPLPMSYTDSRVWSALLYRLWWLPAKIPILNYNGLKISTMTLSTITLHNVSSCDSQQNIFYDYAESHCAECYYAECHYAECHYVECSYSACHHVQCIFK